MTSQWHLQQLRDFRERLRDLLFANNGEGDAAAAWESLRPFLASTRLSLAVVPAVGLELVPQDERPDRLAAGNRLRCGAERRVGAHARLPQRDLQVRVLRSNEERIAGLVQHGDVRESRQSAAPPRTGEVGEREYAGLSERSFIAHFDVNAFYASVAVRDDRRCAVNPSR